jgi:putative hydrolase of HD superfamily
LFLNKDFIEVIYEAAHIQRWNDHIRPQEGFTELDKQAHKMMILYVLAKFEEDDHDAKLNWQILIEGGIFEFLQRIILTDIKPPIFHELMASHGKELNEWVYRELKRKIPTFDQVMINKMKDYFDENKYKKEKKLLRAAHYLATEWEFRIVYHMNKGIYGIEKIKNDIANEIEEHYNLAGVQKIALNGKTRKFVDLVGKLRFQKRWAQSPRVPETSVMGHELVVAIMGYFCALKKDACPKRAINSFLTGLFHDLPEVLTRDIISPVKRSIEGLDSLIKEIEVRQINEKILPLLPISWHKELIYFTENEFCDKVEIDGRIKYCSAEDIDNKYNQECYNAVDGSMLKGCDNLAAYVEAWLSIMHGITSNSLRNGKESILEMYKGKIVAGIDFGSIYESFENNEKI